ncbi:hypothetical protein CC1G_06946 [Coprinopsis cinerea okayama7|uniref:Phosphatidylglycerol lysyltransferase C-terminal domain-containing protein n=1 Tax=Coprinopsis cinerea (strain Okayama-7 / 130 / ATCC MYA-4618 / FGSC 9003) TaxID=240176 RepID=A8NZS9_COPC7|nr:hypothetical protein CC1G_06946 [Coprinopsis cinerea okayama7\|eukprot:XP_001837740.1 hypothetical protein CC1G_06946 [Coprinopsis cinerea okayama7\
MTIESQGNHDKASIAELVAQYGSSSATAWLEFERYKIWRPEVPIPESEFVPVQGYMTRDKYIFGWGNPLVSSPEALPATARAFIEFGESQGLHVVWACVDRDLEEVLGGEEFGWCTVSCIYEDYIDPAHLIELTSPDAKGQEGQHVVKDLKKNLNRAEKYNVSVSEVRSDQWTPEDRKAVEDGIGEWKASRSGLQLASTSLQPWLDEKHRRYWVARQDDFKIVGLLILTPIKGRSWQIKNAVSFPHAPKGTSEALIYTALKDLYEENPSRPTTPASSVNGKGPNPAKLADGIKSSLAADSDATSEASISSTAVEPPSSRESSDVFSPASTNNLSEVSTPRTHERSSEVSTLQDEDRVAVTFGISAAPELEPGQNLGGWKVKALSKTYKKVASSAKLVNRGEFRRKFDSEHEPMYVCYPPDGFGLDGVNALFKLLKK